MHVLEHTVRAEVLTYKELSGEQQLLARQAVRVRWNAYAPYSRYMVGAALVSGVGGAIYTGCNVENVGYCALHAEHNAIGQMVAAEGARFSEITAIAVYGAPAGTEVRDPLFSVSSGDELPFSFSDIGTAPCCAYCLQEICEHVRTPDVVLLSIRPGYIIRTTLGDCLPLRFSPVALGIERWKA